MERKKLSIRSFNKMKENKDPIVIITAYDCPSAKLAEEAGVDIVFVGDSLGRVVLGYDNEIPVTMSDMLHHSKAVSRGAKNSFILTDMPFKTYQGNIDRTLRNAAQIIQEGNANAVKMEGGFSILPSVEICVKSGIPVVGHLGFTPQSINQIGGYFVRGRKSENARKMIDEAKALEAAGAFMLVLEMVPEELAAEITDILEIPTIGIGAGRSCDGQVLIFHDVVQYASPIKPKFIKNFVNVGDLIKCGISQYVNEVKERTFPSTEHVFHMES